MPQQTNWLQLSPSLTATTSLELTPQRSNSIPELERTTSNDSTFLSNVDPSRRPMPTQPRAPLSSFHHMTAERRAEAAPGIRLAAFNN